VFLEIVVDSSRHTDAASVSYGRRNYMGHLYNVVKLTGTVAVIFVCVISASCHGSSSHRSPSNGGPEQTPVVYAYDLNVLDDKSYYHEPFTITYIINAKSYDVNIGSILPLSGTYEPDTGNYTLAAPTILSVTTPLWSAPSGNFIIQVTSPIESVGGKITSQGEFKVIEVGSGSTSSVTVTVRDSSGVNLSHNTESPVFFTWEQLDDLLGSSAPTWQQQASMAASIINLVLSQMVASIDSVLIIESNKSTIEQNQTYTQTGDAFSKNTHPGSPPTSAIPDQGYRTLQWVDTNGDKKAGPGDSFKWDYTLYWENDLSSSLDILLLGSVQLDGFIEEKDTLNGIDTLSRAGFEQDQENKKPGGVVYDNFNILETLESPFGVFSIINAKAKTLNGGFSISFSKQTS
jgi:hypothetical protein